MSVPAEPVSRRARPRSPRDIAIMRAGAAVVWAIAYLLALHGQRVLTRSDMPVLAGLLLAAYPAIDAAASISEQRLGLDRAELRQASSSTAWRSLACSSQRSASTPSRR